MNTCKTRFLEQYIVQYMASAELTARYSQYNGKPAVVAAQCAKDALYAAEAAWEGLEILKSVPTNIDQFPELTCIFETMRL